jgi:hypothetical protein
MLLAYLVAARQISRRRQGIYVAVAGASLLLVAGVSVLDKQGGGASFKNFLGGYLWGSGGYGTVVTTDRAVVRLLFVGAAGLLPLLLVCGYVLARRAKGQPERLWVAFSPLAAAGLGVGIMRNYFGIQPWMAAPVFLVGLVLSLRLMVEGKPGPLTAPETQTDGKVRAPAAFLAGCFVYGAGVTVMASLQHSDFYALMTLARTHTARADTLVVAGADPRLAGIVTSVAECADRRIVVLNDLSAGERIGGRAFLLSTSGEVKLPLVGRTIQPALASCPLVQELLALYSTVVSRRLPGDRGVRPGTCYLYELKLKNGR